VGGSGVQITSFVSEATTTPAEMLDVRALYDGCSGSTAGG
jgi:hypothetical protein